MGTRLLAASLALSLLSAPAAAQTPSPDGVTAATVPAVDPAVPAPASTGSLSFAEKAAIVGGAVAAGVVAFKGLGSLFKKKAQPAAAAAPAPTLDPAPVTTAPAPAPAGIE